MKKRICVVNNLLYNMYNPRPRAVFGGAEVQLYYIIEQLKGQKHYEISVLGQSGDKPSIEELQGVHFWNVLKSSRNRFVNIYYLLKQFWYFKKIQADTYVVRAASLEVGMVALYCRLFRKKCIYMTAHDLDVDGSFFISNGILARCSYRYGLHNASTVLAQNQHHVDLLLKNENITAHRLPNSFQLPTGADKTKEPKIILWVGRAVDWKRPDRFIELAKHFPAESFTMIINEQDPLVLHGVEAAAQDLKNLTIIKSVPFTKIDQYFKQSKLFVNTSDAEGFPNTFIQAAMYNCPILSYTVNPDEILTKYAIGWVANNSDETFLQLASTILSDATQRDAFGNNARKYVEMNHDITKNILTLQQYL